MKEYNWIISSQLLPQTNFIKRINRLKNRGKFYEKLEFSRREVLDKWGIYLSKDFNLRNKITRIEITAENGIFVNDEVYIRYDLFKNSIFNWGKCKNKKYWAKKYGLRKKIDGFKGTTKELRDKLKGEYENSCCV